MANNMNKKTVSELKDMIVDLKMQIVKMSVPDGHCPYAYYTLKNGNPDIDCNEVDCKECHRMFNESKEKEIREYVDTL